MAYLSDHDHLADEPRGTFADEWRDGVEENTASASILLAFLFSAIVLLGGVAIYFNPHFQSVRAPAPTAFAAR